MTQLVLNNTTLTNANKSLTALVKKQAGDIKNLEREIARLKKTPQAQARPRNPPNLCANYKKEGYHQAKDCCELATNKEKLPPGWRSAL